VPHSCDAEAETWHRRRTPCCEFATSGLRSPGAGGAGPWAAAIAALMRAGAGPDRAIGGRSPPVTSRRARRPIGGGSRPGPRQALREDSRPRARDPRKPKVVRRHARVGRPTGVAPPKVFDGGSGRRRRPAEVWLRRRARAQAGSPRTMGVPGPGTWARIDRARRASGSARSCFPWA
jgi:hypothetical protein